MASPVQDLKKLRASGAAASGELREFLKRMQGRSAADVLDTVSTSGLFKGLVTATLGMVLLVAILTVGPYFWEQASSDGEGKEQPAAADASSDAAAADPGDGRAADSAAADAAATPGQNPAAASTTAATDPDSPATPAAAEALGIGETKQAPLDVNPLDNSNDDLLKGLD